jgi:hypothetical protein
LGIWKDYEELELALSMPELLATLTSKRDLDYQEKKFLAAIQGVDLDKQSGKSNANAWEEMKARVFSGGKQMIQTTSFLSKESKLNKMVLVLAWGWATKTIVKNSLSVL